MTHDIKIDVSNVNFASYISAQVYQDDRRLFIRKEDITNLANFYKPVYDNKSPSRLASCDHNANRIRHFMKKYWLTQFDLSYICGGFIFHV